MNTHAPRYLALLTLLAGLGLLAPRAAGQALPGGAVSSEGRPQESANSPAKETEKPAVDDFAQVDLDHDGRISASEYAASPQSAIDRISAGKRGGPAGSTGGFDLANNEGNPERSRFFRRLDMNKDGYISREEWEKAGQPLPKPPKP